MNGETLNKLALIKSDMGYLYEILMRTDRLFENATTTLTELEQKGNYLCGDELTPTVNHLFTERIYQRLFFLLYIV